MNNPDEMNILPPSEGEGIYDDEPERTDPLAEKISPAQARLIYRMTMPNLIMRVLRFLLPHEAASLAPEATEKLLSDDIIEKVVLGEGRTYMLIYERLVALEVIEDQKLGEYALAYLRNPDPLQEKIDHTLVEEEVRSNTVLGVVPTALTFTADALLFNFDEDSFLVHGSLVGRVKRNGHTLMRAVDFQYIFKCGCVGAVSDQDERKKVRSQALGVSRGVILEHLRDNPRLYFGVYGGLEVESVTLIDVDIFRAMDHKGTIFI